MESLPIQYVELAKIEAARATARMYLKTFIRSYQENKRSQFSGSGLEQVIEDMRTISVSLMELFNNVSDAVEEQQLLLFLGSFISCPQADLLQMYALSLQIFGTQYALEIYDLMRLMVKIRIDCSAKTRKGMLALCAEFNLQLQCVVAADGRALGGASKKRPVFLSVFSDLCPKVGVEHCTGLSSYYLFSAFPF